MGEDSESLRAKRSRRANVDQLERKLLASKQRVVLHLKKARSIERSILQAELVEKQKKESVKLASIPSNRTNVANSIKDLTNAVDQARLNRGLLLYPPHDRSFSWYRSRLL